MIQKLLYKGHKRKVHKGTRGGHYVIYNKKKVYLKPISVKKKTKKKTTKKKTTKGKTKSSIRMPRMSNFKKLFGGKKVLITVPEEEPEGDLGIKLTHTRGQRVKGLGEPPWIWRVKNITNGSFGARSGLRAGNCLTMINTRNKLVDFKPTARASTAPGGLLSKQDVIDMINTSRPLYLIFN